MDLMNFEIENWDAIPGDEAQKAHWRERLDKATAAKLRKTELEEYRTRLEAQKVKVQTDLRKSEEMLPEKIFAWAQGKKTYKTITEQRQKVSDIRILLEDIEAGLGQIDQAIVHETRTPQIHGLKALDEIKFVIQREEEKKAKANR
ncbi:MAG: hypothetical protein ABSB32_06030 [Thermodesulfobacteriota bacterium]|jgi:hypothetical protein